jgi:hypothetical protein
MGLGPPDAARKLRGQDGSMNEMIAAHGGGLVGVAAGRRVADVNRRMLTLLRSLLYFHSVEGQA